MMTLCTCLCYQPWGFMRKKHRDLLIQQTDEYYRREYERVDEEGLTDAQMKLVREFAAGEEGLLLLIFITIQAMDGD